jgi:hypothetical protein
MKPLTRCASCESDLLQPATAWRLPDGDHAIARWCPECDARDLVRADERATIVWMRREARLRRELERLADGLERLHAIA